MLKIEYEHKGKKHKSLKSAFDSAIMSGIEKVYSKKLKPFEKDIKKHNGQVTITVIDGSEIRVTTSKLPDDLAKKIIAALRQQ